MATKTKPRVSCKEVTLDIYKKVKLIKVYEISKKGLRPLGLAEQFQLGKPTDRVNLTNIINSLPTNVGKCVTNLLKSIGQFNMVYYIT